MIPVHRFSEGGDSQRAPKPSLAGELVTVERLETHLALLNQQIEKFSKMAVEAKDCEIQEQYWKVARDLSREAFEVSRLLHNLTIERLR